MKRFLDHNGYTVEWSFDQNPFHQVPKHVLVICRYQGKWLLTKHKNRGFEFPGGKIELLETLEEAARREVFEETGAIIQTLQYIGQYRVNDPVKTFVKAVFYSEVEKITEKDHYYETGGPLIMEDISNRRIDPQFSFVMKDEVISECLSFIEKNSDLKN